MSISVADIVTTAVEGGSNYWINTICSVSSTAQCTQPWYADPAFYSEGWLMQVDTDDEVGIFLGQADWDRGWDYLKHNYGARYERLEEDDGQWDAEDADVLLQLCLFQEIIYG